MTEVLAEVYRNKTVESVHYGSIVVSDKTGNILYHCGNPDKITYIRSSAKAFQFIPVYESGAIKKYGHNLQQIAVMLGSHNGSDLHQQVVKSNLELIGLDESYLKCGSHTPYEYTVMGRFPREGETFSQLAHNCSGKHSGQLALALMLGDDPAEYINPDSRTQTLVREVISELYDYPIDKLQMGIDGCSLPNYALPLRNMAKAYAQIVSRNTKSKLRLEVFEKIIEAMTTHPLMVSGNGRVDLAVAEACRGDVILKIGGEAVELIGLVKEGIGIAIKMADGNKRGLEPVIVEVLRQLKVIDDNQVKKLARFSHPQLFNQREINIGEVVPVFELKKG